MEDVSSAAQAIDPPPMAPIRQPSKLPIPANDPLALLRRKKLSPMVRAQGLPSGFVPDAVSGGGTNAAVPRVAARIIEARDFSEDQTAAPVGSNPRRALLFESPPADKTESRLEPSEPPPPPRPDFTTALSGTDPPNSKVPSSKLGVTAPMAARGLRPTSEAATNVRLTGTVPEATASAHAAPSARVEYNVVAKPAAPSSVAQATDPAQSIAAPPPRAVLVDATPSATNRRAAPSAAMSAVMSAMTSAMTSAVTPASRGPPAFDTLPLAAPLPGAAALGHSTASPMDRAAVPEAARPTSMLASRRPAPISTTAPIRGPGRGPQSAPDRLSSDLSLIASLIASLSVHADGLPHQARGRQLLYQESLKSPELLRQSTTSWRGEDWNPSFGGDGLHPNGGFSSPPRASPGYEAESP